MSLPVQVFGRRHDEAIDALMRPATEKRQGTKSRWSIWWRWRERYGDLVAAAGLVSLDCSGWGDGSAGEYGDWPGAGALRGDAFGVRGGQNWRLCVSAGVAGGTPARAVGVRTIVDQRGWHHDESILIDAVVCLG